MSGSRRFGQARDFSAGNARELAHRPAAGAVIGGATRVGRQTFLCSDLGMRDRESRGQQRLRMAWDAQRTTAHAVLASRSRALSSPL